MAKREAVLAAALASSQQVADKAMREKQEANMDMAGLRQEVGNTTKQLQRHMP
jgi:hypothetical protein